MRLFTIIAACVLTLSTTPLSASAVPSAAGVRHDSRPLTGAERATFLKLLCRSHYTAAGVTHCVDRIGYTSTSRPNDDLRLIAILHGALTRAGANQAYVTYASEWEPHATNYGGGILFEAGRGAWTLARWYPGGQMDKCLVLPGSARERFLCWWEYAGMGMVQQRVVLRHVPPGPSDQLVLSAQDTRGAFETPLCRDDTAGSATMQRFSLAPPHRSRNGAFAEAIATYATAEDLKDACSQKDLKHVRTVNKIVLFKLSGGNVTVTE